MTYAALSLLSDLRSKDIDWILSNSELRTVLANTVLVREEEPSDSIFLVSDGLFEVYVFANSASQRKINQLGPGEVIGEVSWLDRKPISASVRAIESSSVIAINTDTLDRKLNEDFRICSSVPQERSQVSRRARAGAHILCPAFRVGSL